MMTTVVMLLAVTLADNGASPSPAPSPLKQIIRVHSTEFCSVFRDNVFHALQGLRINDAVLVEGSRFLNAVARDSVTDPGSGAMGSSKPKTGAVFGNGTQLDRYRSGQAAHAVAENLTKIYQLLSDTDRFPDNPQTDAERDLDLMKNRLLAIAQAQQQSLNILEGTYESDSLNDLLSRNSGLEATLGIPQTNKPDTYEAGDPVLQTGGATPLPVTPAVSKSGSLYDTTPIGEIAAGLAVSRAQTGSLENFVAPAIEPGISRCKSS